MVCTSLPGPDFLTQLTMTNEALLSFCNPGGLTSMFWSGRLREESQSAIDDHHHPTFREKMSLRRDCFLLLFSPQRPFPVRIIYREKNTPQAIVTLEKVGLN
jgi:hypothetical protein